MRSSKPVIVKHRIEGLGMVAMMQGYDIYRNVQRENAESKEGPLKQARITHYTMGGNLDESSTGANISPSLTKNECSAVVPPGKKLLLALEVPFYEKNGIAVSDVPNTQTTPSAQKFIREVQKASEDKAGVLEREKTLLELGNFSMEKWDEYYREGDEDFQHIMRESNYSPCREITDEEDGLLHRGYRIDLIFNVENASAKALEMVEEFRQDKAKHCRVLSPDDVMRMDPALQIFCLNNSDLDAERKRVWKSSASALYRPGGCINAYAFQKKLAVYLREKMGTYQDDQGQEQPCYRILFNKKITELVYDEANPNKVRGFRFFDQTETRNKYQLEDITYTLCPGFAVTNLEDLGLDSPAYARFAGPSLKLAIQIPNNRREELLGIHHCMEVHSEGIVLAWQVFPEGDSIHIEVAGTKAFYGEETPSLKDEFAHNRHREQLKIIYAVLPHYIDLALNREPCLVAVKDDLSYEKDLEALEKSGVLKRWVGSRAVGPDQMVTIGRASRRGQPIENLFINTHYGSGGISAAAGAGHMINRMISLFKNPKQNSTKLEQDLIRLGNPGRHYC